MDSQINNSFKSIITLILNLLLYLLICNQSLAQTGSASFNGNGSSAIDNYSNSQNPGSPNFIYELELFPGQVFNGWYYYWSTGSTITGNFQINPPVTWLSISPNSVTSTSCNDIVPVMYSFTAPETPGIYNTVIQDINSIWQNTEVILHITENPTPAFVRSYQVNQGQTISQFDTLHWDGFGPFGCDSNYIPGSTKLFSFREKDSVDWFNMNPSNITIPIFGEGVIESIITGDTTGNDFVYLIEEAQYASRCFFFRIEQNVITGIEDEIESYIPNEYKLEQNYPNPFNPATTIQFSIPEQSFVRLEVFNALGENISILVSEELNVGSYKYEWNADGISSGIYFYKLNTNKFSEMKKLILLK
jgi:hypothetical protein